MKEPRRRIGLEPRRALVVEAAIVVFAERGYEAASLVAPARQFVGQSLRLSQHGVPLPVEESRQQPLVTHVGAISRECAASGGRRDAGKT